MDITAPRFMNEDAAREHLEALRWPDGPFCPHCGSFNAKRLPAQRGRATKAHPEGALRKGVVQCNDCREQFTVTVGTLFESSKVPLHKWVLATFLLCSSKRGMSGHQLARMLGVTQKTAWFMSHRIRESMRPAETEGSLAAKARLSKRTKRSSAARRKTAMPASAPSAVWAVTGARKQSSR